MSDLISRQDAIDAVSAYATIWMAYSHGMSKDEIAQEALNSAKHTMIRILRELPSAQPEWNNHTVACLLADVFGDDCACNFNGIDEWLPSYCEVLDSCPTPCGVACWEQYLKYRHKAERRTNG